MSQALLIFKKDVRHLRPLAAGDIFAGFDVRAAMRIMAPGPQRSLLPVWAIPYGESSEMIVRVVPAAGDYFERELNLKGIGLSDLEYQRPWTASSR